MTYPLLIAVVLFTVLVYLANQDFRMSENREAYDIPNDKSGYKFSVQQVGPLKSDLVYVPSIDEVLGIQDEIALEGTLAGRKGGRFARSQFA